MNNIACLKWGSLYSPTYVNNLYASVKRNLTVPFKFFCFTDDPSQLHPNIEVIPLPGHLKGWWGKTYYFAKHDWEGMVLTIDLDMVIVDNIDCLFEHSPDDMMMVWDFKGYHNNSSVMRFQANKYTHVWKNLNLDKMDVFHNNRDHAFKSRGKKYWGDQVWISENIPEAKIWPTPWVTKLVNCHKQRRPLRDFFLPDETKIIAFHGRDNIITNHLDIVGQWWHAEDIE